MDILAIVSIAGLVIIIIVRDVLHHKEYISRERLKKVKNLSEVEYVFGNEKKDEMAGEDIDEEQFAPLEAIPDGVIPEAPEMPESEGK